MKNINIDKANAISSAAGVASQIPVTPKRAGSISMVISMNTKEREKARIAETIPLDSAVNIPLVKILKPMKNSARVQIRSMNWPCKNGYQGLCGDEGYSCCYDGNDGNYPQAGRNELFQFFMILLTIVIAEHRGDAVGITGVKRTGKH